MSGCCSPGAFGAVFDERQARRDLRRYRKRGLRRDARKAVEFARASGIEGATVLEVGGGIGALQLELLRAGAARAVDVELSPGYEPVAAELFAGTGYEGRVERRVGNVVAEPPDPADVVVMNRVVCCYPDPDGLVGVAAGCASRLLVLTFPTDSLGGRIGAAVINVLPRLMRSEFRTFAHSHERIRRAAEDRGLRLVRRDAGRVWHTAAFERPGPVALSAVSEGAGTIRT